MSTTIMRKSQLTTQQLAVLSTEYEKRKKSVGVAYLLWFILGVLGVHRFYVGSPGWGIIYLFSLGLIGFGLLWDAFALAGMVRRKNEEIEAKIIDELIAATPPERQPKAQVESVAQ